MYVITIESFVLGTWKEILRQQTTAYDAIYTANAALEAAMWVGESIRITLSPLLVA